MSSITDTAAASPWLNTNEAAEYLKARPGTLKNWRHRGEGPRYHIVNRRLVRYHRDELDTYARGTGL